MPITRQSIKCKYTIDLFDDGENSVVPREKGNQNPAPEEVPLHSFSVNSNAPEYYGKA